MAELRNKIGSAEGELASVDREIRIATQRVENLEGQKKGLLVELSRSIGDQAGSLRIRKSRVENEINSLNVKLSSLRDDLATRQATLASLQGELAKVPAYAESLKRRAEFDKLFEKHQSKISEAAAHLRELLDSDEKIVAEEEAWVGKVAADLMRAGLPAPFAKLRMKFNDLVATAVRNLDCAA
jgi:chromosome segregation ATPase